MGFHATSDDAGRSRLLVTDEPDYIVPLQIAPSSLEDCLKQGRWLVVSMSVWSVHDFRAGLHAIKLVKEQGGVVKLGLRPFNYPKENATWVPGLGAERMTDQVEISVAEHDGRREVTIQGKADSSPVWLVIAEGNVVGVRFGQLSTAEIEDLISQLLSTDH